MDVKCIVEEIEEEILKVRRHMHRNPELSLQEYNTTELIETVLENTTIELKRNGDKTGIIGVLKGKNKGETLAIRADIDALPIVEETGLSFTSQNEGVMHACGHDIHTSVLLGTALVLDRLKDSINGNVKFIFQPAEETMQGAIQLLEDGVLENPKVDSIICLHCWPTTDAGKIGIRHGAIMAASDQFEIEVIGVGGHAAHPHKSIDPIPIASQIVTGLQTIVSRSLSPLEPAVVTVGQIHGGSASNIIAKSVKLSGTVRSLSPDVSKKVKESIISISDSIAKGYNAKAVVVYKQGCPPVINNDELVDMLTEVVTEELGEENLEYLDEPSMGGEDFAFYLQHVEGMLFRLGTGSESDQSRRPLHNPEIIFDEKSISTGIRTMSSFALKYLS